MRYSGCLQINSKKKQEEDNPNRKQMSVWYRLKTNKKKFRHNSTSNTELTAPEEKIYSVEIAKNDREASENALIMILIVPRCDLEYEWVMLSQISYI